MRKTIIKSLRGVLLGAGVTSIIQSSSATTVMVVGFVNSGIMKLRQAIGVIMGANIGTTVTAWILSLVGIQGDSILIKLLKPASWSPVIALIGVIFILFLKSTKKKDVGTIMIGFAILMLGMETMSSAVKPLADIPEFTNILTLFSNPLLGVLAGALITGIIQSSSASVGILQALSLTGSMTYATAMPIIMGQNIGTCITALLSAIGTNKNAKRAAVVHLYFNIIGTVTFLTLFYLLNYIFNFAFVNYTISPIGIAVVHSIFNILGTSVLLPLTKQLEKLACLTIKSKDTGPEEIQLLDERFLSNPSFAIAQAKTVARSMAENVRDSLILSLDNMKNYSETNAQNILESESKVDMYEDKLGTYLVKLSGKDLTDKDSHEASKLLHCIGDFERISDHSTNLLEVAQEMRDKNIVFSDEANKDLDVIYSAVREILNTAIKSFTDDDLTLAAQVEPLEEVIDLLKAQAKTRHIDRLQKGTCTIELGFIFADLLANLERVSDHCSNIAVCIIEVSKNSFDTHKYLNSIKSSGETTYSRLFEEFKNKYTLS
ncbi:MAG: Na/Pi cotransporter family protein [Eubacteriales bacterium]